MSPEHYSPSRGDIVWLEFDPQAGHEQAGRRPALVISASEYNRKVGLALVCPITNRSKGYPFEVRLPDDCEAVGVVLADQLKSLDWRTRNAEKLGDVSSRTLEQVLAKIQALLVG